MTNRRIGRRNQINSSSNISAVTVFICIVITIISVTTTIIVLVKNRKNTTPIIPESNIEISKENIVKINKLISFLNSNIYYGDVIEDDYSKYYLTCKYYTLNNKCKEIPKDYISQINSDTYIDLGYIFFDDLKDDYMYIDKQEYINTYNKILTQNEKIQETFSKYYISSLDGIVVPKNLNINDTKQYKVKTFLSQQDKLVITMEEVNIYKLYEDKSYEQIVEYLNSEEIDETYSSNSSIKIEMVLQDGNYVFSKYSDIK